MNKRYLFFGALLLNAFGILSQNHKQPCDLVSAEAVYDGCFGYDFILVFEDEFKELALDEKTWGPKWPPGAGYYNPNDDAQEYNTLQNVTVNNGIATITAKYEPGMRYQAPGNGPGGDTMLYGTDNGPNWRNYNYTSASVWSNYVFGSGYFEIKCKVPGGPGYWPAFWLYNGSQGLGNPELDIFEMWDNNAMDINMTIHNNDMMCGEEYHVEITDPWYTIGAYWDDWKIIWMVNGSPVQVTYRRYIPSDEFPFTGIDCDSPEAFGWVNGAFPTTPMNIIFNLAVTDDVPSIAPATMEVEYIRFYQQRANCDAVGTYPTTASLGLDDDATIIAGLGKPYYHNITKRIINIEGTVTLLSNLGLPYAPIPQQLRLTASEGMNFNLDPNTGLPISNSSAIFDIQPGAIFEAVIEPNVCSNTPYLPQRDVIDKVPDQMMEGMANQNENGTGTLELQKDLVESVRLSVNPNPSNQDVVTVVSSERTKVIVTNSQGIKVKEIEVQAGENQVNIQDLSSGVYQLYFESLKETIKLVRL